jgi:prevent-host-death family protein
MKQVKIADLKDRLSQHLRAVEQGEEIEVTDRRRPIARIVPVPGGSGPTVAIQPAKRRFSDVRRKRHRAARWPVSSLELLMEDRRKR